MRIVFLVGNGGASTRMTIEHVCRVPGIEPVAVLLDTGRPTRRQRWRNLRWNIGREGPSYLLHRALAAARAITDRWVEQAPVDPAQVRNLLRRAFPDRYFSLEELGSRFGFPVREVGNLNHPDAARALAECNADLAVVIGTRVLKRSTFGIPKLGSINLHKGKVPEYRGMPPGFWEIYDRANSAGVTVHFVDDGLDSGDVVAEATIPIESKETPASLIAKLHEIGARTMARAVAGIFDGSAARSPQPPFARKPRTKPTRAQVRGLQARLPFWRQRGDAYALLKNLYCLAIYYSGVYELVRARNRRRGSRGVVILYHRVNDYAKDVLTVDTETFAAQLLALAKRYPAISTSELVGCLRQGKNFAATSIAIHFDDCYRDVWTEGAPLLTAAAFPATAFINSGFIDTDRVFAHDAAKYPFRFPNFRSSDVRAWCDAGFEVGAHTVNHVDLGRVSMETATWEIVECGKALTSLTGRPVEYFSFPFGRVDNIRPETAESVRQAGYIALFSAHGGVVGPETHTYDIPRINSSGELRPLYLLLEVEGLGLSQIGRRKATV